MGNPIDDRKTRSDLVQRTKDLGDVEDKHDFFFKKLHAHGVSGLISG